MIFEPTFWHWLALAAIFLVIEIVVPVAFFLWLTLAAAATAVLALLMPDLSWQAQFLAFALFCVLSLLAWHRFAREGDAIVTDQPTLNQRNQGYVGRTLLLSEPIVNGVGKVTIEDSQWKVNGEDAIAGSPVKVIAVNGSILQVELA